MGAPLVKNGEGQGNRTALSQLQRPHQLSPYFGSDCQRPLTLKCSQVTGLGVSKPKYDLPEKGQVLRGTEEKQPRPAKDHQCPSSSVLASRVCCPPSLAGFCHPGLSLDSGSVPFLGSAAQHCPFLVSPYALLASQLAPAFSTSPTKLLNPRCQLSFLLKIDCVARHAGTCL